MNKVYHSIEELSDRLEEKKRGSRTLVLANGCFDILHVGHVRYLRDAAELGDILVVALNDDESTSLLKGAKRPVMPAKERAEILSELRSVDYVLIFRGRTVDEVIEALKPNIHAKGTDYTVETVPELETSRSVGCETVITGDPKDHSSGDIIRDIADGDKSGPH